MAELKSSNFTSLVSKKTRRARARILQNFGKAEKTTDELFDVYHLNFNKQQNSSLKLQKELKNYTHCLKAMHDATTSLNLCLLEMHEKEWPKHDVFENNTIELDHSHEDLEEKLKESVLIPFEQYLSQFSEIRDKIAKRGRKLVDYDSNRHNYETLQASNTNNRPSEDNKLVKSREQLVESKKVYESLNTELHDELPALYDSRIPFITSVLQRLFSANIAYHSSNLSIYKSFADIIEQLAIKAQKGVYNISNGRTLQSSNHITGKANHEISYAVIDHKRHSNVSMPINNNDNRKQSVENNESTKSYPTSPIKNVSIPSTRSNGQATPSFDEKPAHSSNDKRPITSTTSNSQNLPQTSSNIEVESKASNLCVTEPSSSNNDKMNDSNTQERQRSTNTVEVVGTTSNCIPPEATTNDLPPGVLYKVKASYKYIAEDDDELSFDAGEIIRVVEYDDPLEQEEGWLMGIKELSEEKGLFPANFTRAL